MSTNSELREIYERENLAGKLTYQDIADKLDVSYDLVKLWLLDRHKMKPIYLRDLKAQLRSK